MGTTPAETLLNLGGLCSLPGGTTPVQRETIAPPSRSFIPEEVGLLGMPFIPSGGTLGHLKNLLENCRTLLVAGALH